MSFGRDHQMLPLFEVALPPEAPRWSQGTHPHHEDRHGSWTFLHHKLHALIDIVQPSSGLTSAMPALRDYDFPSPAGKPPTHLDPIKIYRGEDAETVWRLRSDLPYLSKMEISDYRNSFYQNLCLCMLTMGHHRAFSELYHLVDKQEKERQAAGPDSLLWSMSPISMQEDKLTLLKDCLSTAEDYYRVDNYRGMYESYLRLSKYFQAFPEDKWLVDHFLVFCWEVSMKIIDDDHLKHAEANYYLGLAIELNKDFADAFKYFRTLYVLSKNRIWKNEDNKLLFLEACEHLAKIRVEMAEIFIDNFKNAEMAQRISYLREAFDYSKESGNRKLEGKCAYKLGIAYLDADKSDVAINYLMQYYAVCKAIDDEESLCIACEALAKVFKIQKKYEDCIKFLEEFADTAERTSQKEVHSRACRALGDVYNHLGEFSKASGYFSRSFGISRGMNDNATVDEARVFFGVSQGNNINMSFDEHVYAMTKVSSQRLLLWKKDCKVDASGIGNPINDKPIDTLAQRNPKRDIFDYIGALPKL